MASTSRRHGAQSVRHAARFSRSTASTTRSAVRKTLDKSPTVPVRMRRTSSLRPSGTISSWTRARDPVRRLLSATDGTGASSARRSTGCRRFRIRPSRHRSGQERRIRREAGSAPVAQVRVRRVVRVQGRISTGVSSWSRIRGGFCHKSRVPPGRCVPARVGVRPWPAEQSMAASGDAAGLGFDPHDVAATPVATAA